MSEEHTEKPGICYLVGAGPGDPGLLTLRAKQCLEMAQATRQLVCITVLLDQFHSPLPTIQHGVKRFLSGAMLQATVRCLFRGISSHGHSPQHLLPI